MCPQEEISRGLGDRIQRKAFFRGEVPQVFGFGGVGTNVNITSRIFGQTTITMVGPRNLQMRTYLSW